MDETAHKIDVYSQQGWYPCKWSHHPKAVKDAIQAIGYRPKMKECFFNCQRFMVGIQRLGESIDSTLRGVEYHEGFVFSLIVFNHAWLVLDGKVVDLTLDPDREYRYLLSKQYSIDEIITNMIKHRCWSPVDELWMAVGWCLWAFGSAG